MTPPISDILDLMPKRRILVIGDVMLDRFVYGRTDRVSPEAPALVIAADHQDQMLGGAANVALNLSALGAESVVVGLIGADDIGAEVRAALERLPNTLARLVVDPSRTTTLKVRFVNPQFNTHLLRLDWENASAATGATLAEIIAVATNSVHEVDAVIISDYQKGVVQREVVAAVTAAAELRRIPVIVDPKGRNFNLYHGATAIAPNLAELALAYGRPLPQNDAEVEAAASAISLTSGVASIVVKRGAEGVQAVRDGRTYCRFAATARRVIDVSGAGDTLVAALTLSWAAGSGLANAVRIANAAAGIAVAKKGTASVTLAELRHGLLGRVQHEISPKVFGNISELTAQVEAWKQDGLAVGFTNGCFDLLHPGHVFLLTESRNRVDRLVLALNADVSVRRLKGPSRPIQNEVARLTVAAALEAVDAVILFEEDTPLRLITALKPNVLFKGGDYRLDQVVGREIMESSGGRVELIQYLPNTSTTLIVKKMTQDNLESRLELAGD